MEPFLLQPRWARDNVARCYASFVVQFDTLHDSQVVWEPYNLQAQAVRAPHLGLSPMCFRDQGFWMTKEKLVFDVYVRDHSPQRAMRQFGLYQEFPPPAGDVINRARQR